MLSAEQDRQFAETIARVRELQALMNARMQENRDRERLMQLLNWPSSAFVTEAEREISRRGLRVAYVRALSERIGAAWMLDDPEQRYDAIYGIMTASPEVRVQAMLDVLAH